MPLEPGKVMLVIEVERPRSGALEWARVTLSIPGRPDPLRRVWTMPSAALGATETEDMVMWLSAQITEGLSLSTGIQGELRG